MLITWYGHSCFSLSSPSGCCVLDPYSNDNVPGLKLPRDIVADLVVCSHGHADHNAEGLINLSGSQSSDIRVETLATYHDEVQGAKRGNNFINIVMIDGVRIAHLGDLGCDLTDGQIHAIGRVDALLIPVGGYYTIDAALARSIADRIGAAVTIPMHYRGEGFGYDVISTVDEFAALSPDVERLSGNTLEIKRGADTKRTVIFTLNS